MKYLNSDGLKVVLSKLKEKFYTKSEVDKKLKSVSGGGTEEYIVEDFYVYMPEIERDNNSIDGFKSVMPLSKSKKLNVIKYKAKFIKNKNDVDVYLTFNDSANGEQKYFGKLEDYKNNVPEQCKVKTENFIGLSTIMAEFCESKKCHRGLCSFYIYKEIFFVEPILCYGGNGYGGNVLSFLKFKRYSSNDWGDDKRYYYFKGLEDKTFDWFYIGRYRLN